MSDRQIFWNGTPLPTTTVEIDLEIPPRIVDLADARIPEHIPNIRECEYLSQPFVTASDEYQSADDRRVLTDDEVFRMALDVWDRGIGRPAWVPVPLTHSVYEQALDWVAEAFNEDALTIEIDRAGRKVIRDGRAYAVRLAWMHSPGPEGESFGSNNWTPERGKKSADSMAEFERINEGRL